MKQLISLLVVLLLFGCDEDFTEINTNENAPGEVQPSLLLRQVLYDYGDKMSYEGFVAGSLLSQHFSMIDFNLFDRHALASPQEGGDPWPIIYLNLRDVETILRLSRENVANAVYEGPALVMKSYLAMVATDLYGDVPYFEAFRANVNGVTKPAYDAQEDIYLAEEGIFDNLEKAIAAIDGYQGAQPLEGDILYDGDLEGWVRFANSLRIKAAMRISARQDLGELLQSIVDEGRYIQDREDNASFPFEAGPPNNYPMQDARIGIFNVFLMSKTAENVYQDAANGAYTAREFLNSFYRPAATSGEYVGIENGIDPASAITPDDFARPGTIWREESGNQDFNYLTNWETNFFLAEAASRGYIDGEPFDYYEEAFLESAAYWNVVGAPCSGGLCVLLPDDPDEQLETILRSKWAVLIGSGYEAWIDWRRTGVPELSPAAASLNDGLYPIRMPYPSDGEALNFENFTVAAEATDGNSINFPVWWDVE